jgi:hypothetical protein
LALVALVPPAAHAAECPSGNLLAGPPAMPSVGVTNLARVSDGVSAPEGAFWNVPLAAVLAKPDSHITWDLGQPTTLGVAWIQADANDYYTISGSDDGVAFTPLGRIEPVDGDGLRGRTINFPTNTQARYLRFGGGSGDGYYSVSEIQVFCQKPTPFPPKLRVAPASVTKPPVVPFWDDKTSARWELILSVLGLLLLLWRPGLTREEKPALAPAPPAGNKTAPPARSDQPGPGELFAARAIPLVGAIFARIGAAITFMGLRPAALRPEGHPTTRAKFLTRMRDRLLAFLGVLAALTYINFGSFHFGNFIHDWEWTHYYIGSKYFKELSYDRLYECLATADIDDGLRARVEPRKLTNLRTNILESSAHVLAHPEACKQHFTPERWTAFKKDVSFFRNRQSTKRWDDLHTDHGYNGTPVWNIAGSLLANTAPASTTQLYALAMLDLVFLAGTYALIWWAFGWRALCVALLVFATNFPSRFYWTGGSFLRWDWLFYLTASVACLRKQRPMLGGAALAYSTLLRVFPGFTFLGPLLGLGYFFYKHRRLEPRYVRFFAGAALATALLVPTSLAVSGGVHGYQRFVENTIKHKETPLTNYMGLRTVVAYRPLETGQFLKDDKLVDPWQKWKDARIQGWRNAKVVYVVLVAAYLFIIGLAARYAQPWVAAALGVTIIPVGVELTCYYYAFVIAVAVLWAEREEVGLWLLFMTAFTQFAAWAPFRGMPTWLDEQYTYMSVATIAVFTIIVLIFRKPIAQDAALVGVTHRIDIRKATPRPTAAAAPGLAAGKRAPTPAEGPRE